MKLVSFETSDGARRAGALDGDEISVLDVPDMRTLFERGLDPAAAAAASSERVALADVRLCAPIVPKKFFHTSGNFREHEEESKVVGWSHEIAPWIVFFQNVDAIIGKPGRHFDAHEAASYIAGYTIFNDITARDIQRREMRSGVFSFCKAIDTFCPLGPWIVTPDEVGDPHDLEMRLRVNGELRQESHSGNMSVTIAEIIAHYSALGYSAGDIISTGTVSGVAGFRENAAEMYLRPGDVVECEIEKIGTLSNPVISWEQAYGVPAPPLQRW